VEKRLAGMALTKDTVRRIQCGESTVPECGVHHVGGGWAREAEAAVEALFQEHRCVGIRG
jgi:hypothetical protein